MSIEKGKEILGNIPIYHSHIPKFFVMYGKSMLHFIFFIVYDWNKFIQEVISMTKINFILHFTEVKL